MNALLRAKSQDLRQANKILSRRHRAKGARLQNRGKITIEEVRDLIDQMDIDTQFVAELSTREYLGDSRTLREADNGIGEDATNMHPEEIISRHIPELSACSLYCAIVLSENID
jgi:hypothetical protein